tara:strand:- start:6483 stop:7493 length:1011 start_codon:yes stop_codon:yes gene_type:complete
MSFASTCSCADKSAPLNRTCSSCGLPVVLPIDEESKKFSFHQLKDKKQKTQIQEIERSMEEKMRNHCKECNASCKIFPLLDNADKLREFCQFEERILQCKQEIGYSSSSDQELLLSQYKEKFGEPDPVIWGFFSDSEFLCIRNMTKSDMMNELFGKRWHRRETTSNNYKIRHHLAFFFNDSETSTEKQAQIIALAFHYTMQYINEGQYTDKHQENRNVSKVISVLSEYQVTRGYNLYVPHDVDPLNVKCLNEPEKKFLAKFESPYALLLYDKLTNNLDESAEEDIWKKLNEKYIKLKKFGHVEVYKFVKRLVNQTCSEDIDLSPELITQMKSIDSC